MDEQTQQQWRLTLVAVKRAAAAVARQQQHRHRLRFADWLIVAMYLWAVLHDRCQSWACDRAHYNGVFRPRVLPSVSQFNRRLNHPRTGRLLQRTHEQLAGDLTATALSYLDGKPLLVGVASKDPDARKGHVMGGFAKGYKLHAWMSEDRRIPLWSVMPLNVGEQPVAEAMVAWARQAGCRFAPCSLLLADQNYDSHDLHKGVDGLGTRLLLIPKGGDRPRHAVTLRQMGPARRELIDAYARIPGLVRLVHGQRVNAEGILGNLCGYGGGLTPLPPWVRRLQRVRRWVGGKILLYHARLRVRTSRKNIA